MDGDQAVRIKFLAEFRELFNPSWRNIVFYGGRGSGKSQHVALALILRGRQSKLRILCTREIQNTVKDSVHKLLRDIIDRYGFTDYEVTDKTIRNTLTGTEFIFSGLRHNVNEIKSMEGIDIAWVEEAQSISEASLKVLAPTIRKPGSQLIFTFNRLNELDAVYVRYVMNQPAKTYSRQVNYDVLERAGLLPDSLKLELEADRANPSTFAHVWLGQPMDQADNAIIGRTAIIAAMERAVSDEGAVEVGADIARMGNDRTVFTKRKGLRLVESKEYTKLRTTEVCDKLEAFVDHDKTILIKIDDTGVGGGVTDEMMLRGYLVLPINFGASAREVDRYPNLISEAWFYLASIIETVSLDMDADLLMELSSRQWKMDSKGRRGVESKADYKKRGYRSPDKADALILAYYSRIVDPVDDLDDDDEDGEFAGLMDESF
ncbi:PBSX family phage terminase large subunit [Rathayibacter oskolensis]|uniref:PBSX family phage terminase large subunit n=1 Tax=Rathayibacter oskolensis TaxID=1891671 RepID=UPI00265DA6A9|nr:PBSX family phage terminase large subunit [Rathayibacter oskolensis]WKK71469.1 PBSX family phage terminase large subunit [Rathayibacter oskolensis]